MGEHFGDYEIEARIGAGGMAEVYVATRRGAQGFKKRVCLKRVLTGDESDGDLVKAFQDEARLAAHLDHPTIAAVHDLGEFDGKWFMSMELVEGLDLRSLVTSLKARGERVPLEVVLLVAEDVATALAYAGALKIDGKPAGIVHRDVTPSNVLVSIHGEIKLADFGIAKAATRLHRTRTGVVKGKVPYMAPEQALGDDLDQRTDLFALGVVLYELCAGRRPHDGATDLDTLTNAQRSRREPLSKLAPDVPFELVSLIDRMLAPKPSGRPESVQAVLDVLSSMPRSATARRTLAALVRSARDPRGASEPRRTATDAPLTRARGLRRAAPREEVLDGPTVATTAPVLERETQATSLTQVRASSSRRALVQLGIGFGVVFTLGALLLGAVMLAVAGDRIVEAVSPSRPTPAPIVAVASAPDVAPKPPEAPAPVSAPVAVEPPPAPARPRRPRTETVERGPRAPRIGRVAVVVFPFGDVALDGTPAGRAPIEIPAVEGEHTVIVSNGDRRVQRTVTVRHGHTERLVVDLMDGD